MEDTGRPARRTSRGEATRQRLLQAAVELLADNGVRGLTHRRAEERAGVAQGSAKHHFGSWDGLVEAVLAHLVEQDLPLVLAPGPADTPAELVARAQAVMDTVWSRPHLARARLALYVHAAGRPHLQRIVGEARDRFVAQIAAALPGPDAELGARFVAALMDGLVLDQLSAPHPDLAAHAGRLVVHAGLAGRTIAARED